MAGTFFFFASEKYSSFFSPLIGSRLKKKKKSPNKNRTNASNLNASISEREKVFQLLDVQENMNTRRQRKQSQSEEEEGEAHKIKGKNSFQQLPSCKPAPLPASVPKGQLEVGPPRETSGGWKQGKEGGPRNPLKEQKQGRRAKRSPFS